MTELIFVPFWLRVFSITMLSLLLVSGVVFTFHYIGAEGMEDWILVSITSAQVAASGLTAVLLIMYSSRSISTKGLEEKTEIFLSKLVPEQIRKISSASKDTTWKIDTHIVERSPILYSYRVVVADGNKNFEMSFSMLLNVKRLAIYVYIDAHNFDLDRVKQVLGYTIEVSEGVGYTCSFNTSYEERFSKKSHMVAFVNEGLGEDFLTNSYSQLFFLNDITMLIRSFLLYQNRNEIEML